MISGSVASFVTGKGPRQFVKFCIVGATSTVIDFGLLNLLHYRVGLPLALSATISFFVAVCNGFYWNRRWTFRAGEGDAKRQYPKFVATNLVGWLLNLTIMTAVLISVRDLHPMTADETPMQIVGLIAMGKGKDIFPQLWVNAAKAIATVFVTAWNFTASKLWTFKM